VLRGISYSRSRVAAWGSSHCCRGSRAAAWGISCHRLGELMPSALGVLIGARRWGTRVAQALPPLLDLKRRLKGLGALASAQVPSRHGTRPWRIERSGSMSTPCPCRCRLSVRSSEVPRHHGPEKEREGEAMRREREPQLSLSQGRLMVAALPTLGRAPPPAAEI